MPKFRAAVALSAVVLLAACGWIWQRHGAVDRSDPVLAAGDAVTLLPFATLDPDHLPAGWTHRTFWTKPAMALSHVEEDGRPALRCATDGGGSLLLRATDIQVAEYPTLTWDWFIETPISGRIDERTRQGDDHPARLFLRFTDSTGADHATEIIWSNARFAPGDYKVLGDFQHLVADGLAANAGRWRAERIDLSALYRHVSGKTDKGRLTTIGLFCDSDETKERTVAYTTDVVARRR